MLFKKRLLSLSEEETLTKAIKQAEEKTSGEIRVHVTETCKGDPVEECKRLFFELKMHETKHRNGILFYLALKSRTFAVWGDEGIHEKVKDEFWQSISAAAINEFKHNRLASGLEKAVTLCGEKLKLHFPVEVNDTNELSNDISYQ